jgi:predicted nucleic acid-binding protein
MGSWEFDRATINAMMSTSAVVDARFKLRTETVRVPPLPQEVATDEVQETSEHGSPDKTQMISEASFLLRQHQRGASGVLAFVESGAPRLAMSLAEEAAAVRKLFGRYHNVPASLADVCLVRMAEVYDRCLVLSRDSDFHIYRSHGRKTIPLSRPDSI